MDTTAELAGFFTAHAFLTLSKCPTFDPILAFVKSDGARNMMRLVGYETPAAVQFGRNWIATNPEEAQCAVLIFDGRIRMDDDNKCDAVIAEAQQIVPEARSFVVAVPYRQFDSPEGFGVHRPKFMGDAPEGMTYDELAAAFFRGVDQHKEGAAVWNAHLDQSR